MKPRNLMILISSTILLLMAGSLAMAQNNPAQILSTDGNDNVTLNHVAHRNTSKVSGETLFLYPTYTLHLQVDGPPEENSTIILAGGQLVFENSNPPRNVHIFGSSMLTEEILTCFELEIYDGSIHYIGAELNEIISIPDVNANLSVHFEDSWIRDDERSLEINGGVFSAVNTIFEATVPALIAGNNSQLDLSHCIFLTAEAVSVCLDECFCTVDNGLFLSNDTAIRAGDGSVLEITSTNFQGNNTALLITSGDAFVDVHNSSFWGNWNYDIVNNSASLISAQQNFWYLDPLLAGNGEILITDPLQENPCEPEILSNEPITIVPIPPLADGDEPLMWDAVGKYVASGLPVNPTYRVYRSIHPYTVYHPDNLIMVTHTNSWRDPDPPAGRAFYCVTYAINR
jgi:hypothetical protein